MRYLMRLAAIITLFSAMQTLHAQTRLNVALKRKLDSVYYLDQILRRYADQNTTPLQKDSIAAVIGYTKAKLDSNIYKVMDQQDSLNLVFVEKVIKEYGYPGKSLVGEPTNEAAWFVIQHSGKIPQYFPVIQKAGKNKEVPFKRVAMMQDRMLMDIEKEQIYGSQIAGRMLTNKETGKKQFTMFVWPIKNVANVNKRRLQAGFDNTVEVNAKNIGVAAYKVYTLDEIRKLMQ